MSRLPVRIIGHRLPGVRFFDREPVHVGVKKGKEVESPVRADAERVEFDLYVEVRPDRAGKLDYRGPYITGLGKDDRSVALAWGTVDADGHFELFRAAKLRLPPIDQKQLDQAVSAGAVLQATVALSDAKGGPIAPRIPDALLEWEYAANPSANS